MGAIASGGHVPGKAVGETPTAAGGTPALPETGGRQLHLRGIKSVGVAAALVVVAVCVSARAEDDADVAAVRRQADEWRAEHRIIDLHQHLEYTPELLARAIKVMDESGVGLGIDLTPGTVTRGPHGEPSDFEQHKKMEDTLYPGRWVQYFNLDYTHWDDPDFPQQAVRQAEEARRLGAAGFKQEKSLGLYHRDGQGRLLKVDDPKLDPFWERLGELGLPVSIHTGDPKAFFEPYNDKNERWAELKDHPQWWFGDTNKYPTFHGLIDAIIRVVARHPHTTFACLHFGNDAEEPEWVTAQLDKYPNLMVDVAARLPELGRHDPAKMHDLFVKYQDRIMFGTDFQSLERRMILGSSGPEAPPSVVDADVFFAKEWRWFETRDEHWEHMTPIQGNWTISSIYLPSEVLRKIYFDNARKLLARSLPSPVIQARRTTRDFVPDASAKRELWQTARPVVVDCQTADGAARPEVSTTVRALWSQDYLYLRYECPFTELTVFDPPQDSVKRYDLNQEGVSLWDRDVVEAFIGADEEKPQRYGEFEIAPTNEKLDLMCDLPAKDFQWRSGLESAVRVDHEAKIWVCEARIPMSAFGGAPKTGVRWRLNLFRCDRANHASLAWRPTLQDTFHVPERFGSLEFVE